MEGEIWIPKWYVVKCEKKKEKKKKLGTLCLELLRTYNKRGIWERERERERENSLLSQLSRARKAFNVGWDNIEIANNI